MLNYDVVAKGLMKSRNYWAHHTISSPGMAHPIESVFEESYEVRAACRTYGLLNDGGQRKIARAFTKRMRVYQGIHIPDMYDMGYGYDLNNEGVVNCSCVADNASTANAMLETVRFFPDLPETGAVLDSVKRFLDHCLENYLTDTGVMGVGVLHHIINPPDMHEYWCANALFASSLISYAELSGDATYYDAAVPLAEFIGTYDYQNTLWKEWQTAGPQQIIFYTSEGLVKTLSSTEMKTRLQVPLGNVVRKSAVAELEESIPAQATNAQRLSFESGNTPDATTIWGRVRSRYDEFCNWMFDNQLAEGCYHHPRDPHFRCYEPALAWILLDGATYADGFEQTRDMAANHLRYLSTDDGKLYYGLYANDFACALSHMSFATAGAILKAEDSDKWDEAIEGVLDRGEDMW